MADAALPVDLIPVPISSQPGIQRDGTSFAAQRYTDGQWCRFQRSLPRKMKGYQLLDDHLPEMVRSIHGAAQNGLVYVHSGSASHVEQQTVDTNNAAGVPVDRTPAGFAADPNNIWQFDAMFNAAVGSNATALIAHAAPNLLDIDSSAARNVYYGNLFDGSQLQPIDPTNSNDVSGGVVVLHPFLFIYDSGGNVTWSDANQPTVLPVGSTNPGLSGSARITHEKIVKGMTVRGGAGYSPSGLFWSLDSLVRAYFVGGAPVFAFDIVSDQISILSSSGVVEMDGLYFWPGVDRFLVYNGTVRELPNDTNLNFFFDNLNFNARQKVFGVKIPRWGEIWWCAPLFGATECNWAIIYNARENCWYDTPLPDGGRAAAFYAQTLPYPIFSRAAAGANGWPLWLHEIGLDRNERGAITAIYSSFTTSDISRLKLQPPSVKASRLAYIEPDFLQSGTMKMNVIGSVNARGPVVTGADYLFDPTTQLMKFKEERRQMRFHFESFANGGDYQAGMSFAHLGEGSSRLSS